MRQLIVALVALPCNTRFHLAAGSIDPDGRMIEWRLCTKVTLSTMKSGDPLAGIDLSVLELLDEATRILVCQRHVRTLLLCQLDRVLDDQVQLMDVPVQRECMLWPSVTSRRWEALLSEHWQAVDLIYTHVRRAHQNAIAIEMRQKQMTTTDFFQQYAHRPSNEVIW